MSSRELQGEQYKRDLSASRDKFTSMKPDARIRNAVLASIEHASSGDPVAALQEVLETMRRMPRGAARNRCMNTFVRTLGQPSTLATWLDILRDTYKKAGTDGQKVCKILLSYKRHSHYGHYQLLMLVTPRHATDTSTPVSVVPRIKHASQWDMLLSIWRPLATNTSFTSAKRSEPQLLVEPAHSHPFDFVSMVVAGTMFQSTYRSSTEKEASRGTGRYAGVPLVRVDRTWPPHERRERAWLETVEDRVPLRAGDSYFLPSDSIHDVEMDITGSLIAPAITLMLAAESTVLADVYLEQPMLDFHDANPNLTDVDRAMSHATWSKVLRNTAAYLRGASTLRLPGMPIKDSFLMH